MVLGIMGPGIQDSTGRYGSRDHGLVMTPFRTELRPTVNFQEIKPDSEVSVAEWFGSGTGARFPFVNG